MEKLQPMPLHSRGASFRELNRARISYLRRELSERGFLCFKITGASMWPFFRNGEVVIVERVSCEAIGRGDVILAEIGGTLVCHRVFAKRGPRLQTRADASPVPDPPIRLEDCIGKVVAKIAGEHVLRMDRPYHRYRGFIISHSAFIVSHFYPPLRLLKRTFYLFLRKTSNLFPKKKVIS